MLAAGESGCITKKEADARVKAAFLAGQQQASARNQQEPQPKATTVTMVGNVRNPTVLWTPDLTLAKALVAADYTGPGEPKEIYLVHGGLATPVDLEKLLGGEDVPLQAGDVVQIK